jgi:hypothetical protein
VKLYSFGPHFTYTVERPIDLITHQPIEGTKARQEQGISLDGREWHLRDYPGGSPLGFTMSDHFDIEKIPPNNQPLRFESADSIRLEFLFEARNGAWVEDSWFQRIPSAAAPDRADLRYWTSATRVWRSIGQKQRGKLLYELIDKDFPKLLLKGLTSDPEAFLRGDKSHR